MLEEILRNFRLVRFFLVVFSTTCVQYFLNVHQAANILHACIYGTAHTDETNCMNYETRVRCNISINCNRTTQTMLQETNEANLLCYLRKCSAMSDMLVFFFVVYWFKQKNYNKLCIFPQCKLSSKYIARDIFMKHLSCNMFHQCAPCLINIVQPSVLPISNFQK